MRQRLSLAVAMVHRPELLILDEPTSGVDPIARDAFWQLMIDLSRRDKVTIFISTHFMNEAERCDRISLMHAGRVLVSDTPAALHAAARRGDPGGGLHRLSGRRRRGRRGTAADASRSRPPAARTAACRSSAASAPARRFSLAPRLQLHACARRWSCGATRCALTLALLGSRAS